MKKKVLCGILLAAMAAAVCGCGSSENPDSGSSAAESGGKNASGALQAKADASGNYAVNGSFEEEDFTGWTVNNVGGSTEELDIYTRETDCYEGLQCLHFYSSASDVDFSVEQKLTGLEEGSYRLSAFVQGDTAGDADSSVYVYAVAGGETLKAETSLNGYLTWNEAAIDSISVSDGELTIGIAVKNAPGGWGTIDAVTLVKE